MTVDELVSLIQDMGYRAQKTVDEDGDIFIKTRMAKVNTTVWVYSDPDRVASIGFRAGFSDSNVPLEKINSWNRDKRFVCVYLDSDGDQRFFADFVVDDCPPDMIKRYFDIWEDVMGTIDEVEAYEIEAPPGTTLN